MESIIINNNTHLVLITSVLNPKTDINFYTQDQRFVQLLQTIMSVKRKIPNYFIVIIEGTEYTEYQKKIILKFGCNIFYIDINLFNKQYGEVCLIKTFLMSDFFKKINNNKILSINKISGRYILNDNFNFYFDNDTCICKLVNETDSYSKYAYIQTRYYSIPFKYLDNYIEGLELCSKNIFINIEHSFYLYKVIPLDKINKNITKINVCGNIAPNGAFIED